MAGLQQLAPGTVFAQEFRVERALAEGGMGAVYVVTQASTGKLRALKVMHPEFVQDARSRERFAQEARVGAQIPSEHVVEVLGAGVDPPTGLPYLVMELLAGEDLAHHLAARGALAPGEVATLARQLGHALAAAHARGIVHRDLKPENLFVAASRRADVPFTLKVLDFGIAKVLQESRTAVTATTAIGSPLWMAPEQAEAGRISPATDVWALGLIAFKCLTGVDYWLSAHASAASLAAVLREVLFAPMEPATARAAALGRAGFLPPGFDAWFARACARPPEERFRDGGAAVDALVAVLHATASAPPLHTSTPPPPSSHWTAQPLAETRYTPAPMPVTAPPPVVRATPRPAELQPRHAVWALGVLVLGAGVWSVWHRARPEAPLRATVAVDTTGYRPRAIVEVHTVVNRYVSAGDEHTYADTAGHARLELDLANYPVGPSTVPVVVRESTSSPEIARTSVTFTRPRPPPTLTLLTGGGPDGDTIAVTVGNAYNASYYHLADDGTIGITFATEPGNTVDVAGAPLALDDAGHGIYRYAARDTLLDRSTATLDTSGTAPSEAPEPSLAVHVRNVDGAAATFEVTVSVRQHFSAWLRARFADVAAHPVADAPASHPAPHATLLVTQYELRPIGPPSPAREIDRVVTVRLPPRRTEGSCGPYGQFGYGTHYVSRYAQDEEYIVRDASSGAVVTSRTFRAGSSHCPGSIFTREGLDNSIVNQPERAAVNAWLATVALR